MDASWQPDPTGRHQYRWWDGAGWTDSVADNGQSSVDPVGAGAVAGRGDAPATIIAGTSPSVPLGGTPAAPASSSAPPYIGGTTGGLPDYASAPSAPAKKGGKGKWIALVLVAVAALGVVGFLVLGGGGDGSGAGRSTLEITRDQPVVTKKLSMKKGQAYRIRVEPSKSSMDVAIELLAPRAATEDFVSALDDIVSDEEEFDPEDLLSDLTDADTLFSDDIDADLRKLVSVDNADDNGDGDAEALAFYAVADIELTVAVSTDGNRTGEVTMIIEKFDGEGATDYDALTDLFSDSFFSDSDFYSDSGNYSGS